MNKYLFFVIWFLSILLGPITLLLFILKFPGQYEPFYLINIFQRAVGLVAFVMLFWQILLGSFMHRWIEKYGAWVFKFHLTEGAIVYSLLFLHALSFLAYNYLATKVFDPFYVYTGFCLLCSTRTELFYTFGRVAFWFVSAAVLAAKLRTYPWWRENWRKFHILNYIVFFLVAAHSFYVGSDSHFFPFIIFYFVSVPTIFFICVYKIIFYFKK
jgi:predicted ferric reductase